MRSRHVAAGIAVVLGAALPAPVIAAETDYAAVIATLDSEIPAMMQQGHVVGLTVALVDDQDVVMTKGYGLADRASDTPVTADTLFHIGSVSKTFAAATVLQLVEQGRVDLDAPFSRYVPDFRLRSRSSAAVTVRSVLDHHSGIPGDVLNGLMTQGKADPGFRTWLRRALARMYPERRVNTQQAYSNSGYVLLQDLIENVTGESLDSYTATHLFGPMGMSHSSFNDTLAADSALTRNYLQKGKRAVLRPREYVNGPTAGSIVSSANDMSHYLRMLNARGAGVMQPSTFDQMLTPQTDLPLNIGPAEFGLSWFLLPRYWAGFAYLHAGATGYNYSQLTMLRDSKLGVFVSVNTANEAQVQSQVARRALSLMYTAKTGESEPEPTALPRAALDPPSDALLARSAGFYANSGGYDQIVVKGQRLQYTPRGGAPLQLRRMASGWWRTANPDLQMRFRTVEGHRLLVQRTASSSGRQEAVVGEKAVTGPIPQRWLKRLGTYRATNAVESVAPILLRRKVALRVQDGLLLLDHRDGVVEVLQPIRRNAAFTFGMDSQGGRGKGEGAFADRSTLTWMGVRYKRVE